MQGRIKVLVVDDEYIAREMIILTIAEHCPDLQVVGEASDIDNAVEMIRIHKPHLVFLDVHMPGDSGFELFNRIEFIDFEVIFVTGYSAYMKEAFQVSAIGYILKPVEAVDFITAVDNAKNRLHQQAFSKRYSTFVNNTKFIGTDKMKLVISNKDGYVFIETCQIVRCEGWDKYTYFYCSDGTRELCTKNIGTYKQILEPLGFFTCHKSHIINPKFLVGFNGSDTIYMPDNCEVPLARRRKKDFLRLIEDINVNL